MSNPQQNEIQKEIEQIKTDKSIAVKLKQTKKKNNLLQNELKRIAKMQTKKRQNPSRIGKMYIKIQNLFQNEIKQIKWKINLLQDRLEQLKKRQSLLQSGLKQIAKMENLSQNELDQITKTRRIKNYKKMSKEELIIALLKSKRSLAELFNNSFNNDRIRGIKKSSIN